MGIVTFMVASLPADCAEYLTAFGLIAAAYTGYQVLTGFWNIFNQFVLGRIFGPAIDLKSQGKWAGKVISVLLL